MTDEQQALIPESQPEQRRRPTWLQGILIVVASFVIGLGGCLVALGGGTGSRGTDTLLALGGIVFFGGLLGGVVGGVMFLYGVIKAITRL